MVDKTGPRYIQKKDICIDLAGEKGFGLSCLPAHWTLPFYIIDKGLYSSIENIDHIETTIDDWLESLYTAAALVHFVDDDKIIIRSSAVNESMEDKGKFYSVTGNLKNLRLRLKNFFEITLADPEISQEKICIIIQKYIVPSEKGHLSNERRFYKEPRDWQCQIENENAYSEHFNINLRNWRQKINPEDMISNELKCNLRINIQNILKYVASWGKNKENRLHFEWIWNGQQMYLVQVEEEYSKGGFDPKNITEYIHPSATKFEPSFLKKISRENAAKYHKVHNPYVYFDLGLPTTPLYILDNQDTIIEISNNRFPSALLDDLNYLTERSLVIRMDLNSDDQALKQMLPRTHEVRCLDDAKQWLIHQASEILKTNGNIETAFIFHNFIPAESAAFAFASPGERKVQIEALWGIPEGLYYNPHDKYVVDTLDSRINKIKGIENTYKIIPHKNYKPVCVAPDKNGEWKIQKLKAPHDWGSTIYNEEWIRTIARDSRIIAEHENDSISIMWFIGVPDYASDSPVFPWFHEHYNTNKIPRFKNARKKTPFDETFRIETRKDIANFKEAIDKGEKKIRQILVRPMEEALLRDKNTLRLVGELAKKIDASILLEGATLSHAFYQLIQVGANVQVENPFSKDEEKQEFNKLVRDGIPEKIINSGEHVETLKLNDEELFRALREKLVEESFETLDALNHDQVLDELSDVLEVIDGILKHIGSDHSELQERKKKKLDKVGGFDKGLVLLATSNPSPSSKPETNPSMPLNFGDHTNPKIFTSTHQIESIKKWIDKREHAAATEQILNIETPILLEKWEADSQEILIGNENKEIIRATIKGGRSGTKLKIEVSIYSPPKQLKLL
ncbi:MAG: nucleoside triphosphate pyrophosphohydrolase [Gammaproteobacteria bacterium]|nr:nucleoside triphosphate pyrophosphohydrolase [Gammaproteobacteria bacterium]